MSMFPIVPIVDVKFEEQRELHLSICRYENKAIVMTVKQFCPNRKCTTAVDCCVLDENILDERMAEG